MTPPNQSFRTEQVGFLLPLRSCEVADLRREESLGFQQ
jgi:hypothetical protein